MESIVRCATAADVDRIAAIHGLAFARQRDSALWVRATLSAWPRMLAFVIVQSDEIVGYIFWAQKSGIRQDAVVELDQVAVLSHLRGQGLGEKLIRASLAEVRRVLEENGQSLKTILVSTRADNAAQRLYSKTLGAEVVAHIENLYSSTEVLMLADCKNA